MQGMLTCACCLYRYPYDSDADRFIQSNILEIELADAPEDGKVGLLAHPVCCA